MNEKRGVSAIIATLIIILLTLVSVGIIWVVVQNLLRSGAEQIELGQYTLDLEIKSVQVGSGNVTVAVKRNPGQGEFVGMNFIFSNGTYSEIIRENTSLNELDTKSFIFILTKISTSTLKSVSVVPIYKTSSGKESSGNNPVTFNMANTTKTETSSSPVNKISITNCREITSPGSYVLQNDLSDGHTATCLNIHDTSNVYIDCANKTISLNYNDGSEFNNKAITIKNVNSFSLKNCTIQTNIMDVYWVTSGLYLFNSSDGIITNNNFTNYAIVDVHGSSNLQVTNNNFTRSFYNQFDGSNNNRIENNTFYWSSIGMAQASILSQNSSGNSIKNNFIDGHGAGVPAGVNTGADDGIVLWIESGDTVSRNTLQNFWGCGIETVGLVKNSVFSNNTINNASYCGIGGWYWNSLQGNVFSQNKVNNSGTLFTFNRQYALLPEENFVYFTNNLFTDNVITNINNIRGYATDIEMSHVTLSVFGDINDNQFIASNATFTNNDFGTGPGPYIAPRSAIIDGGGNKCGPPSLGQATSPLVCN